MRARFGPFVLDTGARELRRDGAPVHLSPKAYQLLETLIKRRPDALSKADLQDILWPDTFVVETNLANLVGEVRAALGDDPRRPRYLRTVHRFGYAFRDVMVEESDAPARPAHTVCRLVWKAGEAILTEGDNVLGRDPGLPLQLPAPGVSRRHLVVRVRDGVATIEDLGSKNGTYVNGHKVTAATRLTDGDEVLAGSFLMRFRTVPMAATTETEVSR
jgi:DNA-binding winged helix-turn-helix (wHTH) protein